MMTACELPTVAPTGPSESAISPQPPSPTATAVDVIEPAVIARIPLPYPGTQVPFEYAIAVTADAIWLVEERGDHLLRIDTETNRITADVIVDHPLLAASDGDLWMLSRVGGAPEPPTHDLSRVDLVTGQPTLVSSLPSSEIAVGLGGIWFEDFATGELVLLEPDSGAEVRRIPFHGIWFEIACGALWTWNEAGSAAEPALRLDRIDPTTGAVLDDLTLPDEVVIGGGLTEIDGLCWAHTGGVLFGIAPGRGPVVESSLCAPGSLRIAGSSVWVWSELGGLRRIDPMTDRPTGPVYALPTEDFPEIRGMPNWLLLSAGGNLWVLGPDQIVRYNIPGD